MNSASMLKKRAMQRRQAATSSSHIGRLDGELPTLAIPVMQLTRKQKKN